ncbi:hypothetical protein BUALT_Bualt07G0141600 [Buddleja alternifolia]|uniref:Bulb-type lectin domain-containing protein n=1 Tax=Buddleja alternifolia TaxID=168488 RepID=A0AAV6XIT7_9LAMI|nr:hypothetical protein BUALT_Bualt07G0141600 [Buddleja alternifolia]
MTSNVQSMTMSQTQKRRFVLNLIVCYLLFLLPCYADVDAGTDTIIPDQPLRDGDYLDSANKIFRLQFFSPGTSKSKYVGIFYNVWGFGKDKPVWVANRNTPTPNLFAMLMIDSSDGLLKISYRGGNAIVSTAAPSASNTSATILDNGNLVLRGLNGDGSINRTLWQSFDYPTDTLLPGMKLGINFRTGHKWSLSSWVSNEVPSSGSLTLGGDPNGAIQLIKWWQGNVYWKSGVWEKGRFNNTFYLTQYTDINFSYISNENEKYLTYSVKGNISLAKISIDSNGKIEITRDSLSFGFYECSLSGILEQGCVMEFSPKCRKSNIQFRGRRGVTICNGCGHDENQKLSLFDCEAKCRQNCSCIAFASVYSNGTGCEIFNKDLFFWPSVTSESVVYFLDTGRATKWWIWLIASAGGALLVLSIMCCLIRRNFKRKGENLLKTKAWELWFEERAMELMDLTLELLPCGFGIGIYPADSCPDTSAIRSAARTPLGGSSGLPIEDRINKTNLTSNSFHQIAPTQKTEIIRCINIALLCVQDDATDRPSMTDAISILANESLQLPEPKQPAFFIETTTREAEQETDSEKGCTNDLSISVMRGR